MAPRVKGRWKTDPSKMFVLSSKDKEKNKRGDAEEQRHISALSSTGSERDFMKNAVLTERNINYYTQKR